MTRDLFGEGTADLDKSPFIKSPFGSRRRVHPFCHQAQSYLSGFQDSLRPDSDQL